MSQEKLKIYREHKNVVTSYLDWIHFCKGVNKNPKDLKLNEVLSLLKFLQDCFYVEVYKKREDEDENLDPHLVNIGWLSSCYENDRVRLFQAA